MASLSEEVHGGAHVRDGRVKKLHCFASVEVSFEEKHIA